MATKTIIIDTNFLLIPGTFGVDIFAELEKIVDFHCELAIIDKTIHELDSIIEKQKGKYKIPAKIGKELIKAKDLKIVPTTSEQSVDDIIVGMAKDNKDIIVATQDKELKKRLTGNKLIIFKQKKYLAIV